jgi:hypothetical protein
MTTPISSIPREIEISDRIYPIQSLTRFTGRHDYPYMRVEGLPIISVEHFNGNPLPDAIQRAECALRSFTESGGKYSIIPSSSFSCFEHEHYTQSSPEGHYKSQLREFDIACVDEATTKVETYDQFDKPHFCVYINEGLENEYKFNIWDRELMHQIALKYNERQKGSRFSNRLNRETPSFNNILSEVH